VLIGKIAEALVDLDAEAASPLVGPAPELPMCFVSVLEHSPSSYVM
jgi:hypothetical protein